MNAKLLVMSLFFTLLCGETCAREPALVCDTANIASDTATVKKKDKKKETPKETEYRKLLKKETSHKEGLFTVRHIEDKWYFEIPESIFGKLLLAVTRATSVPANFAVNIGEEISENVVYLEKRDNKTILMRAYSQSQKADEGSDIETAVERATNDPIAAKFTIIQDDSSGIRHGYLVDATSFCSTDNFITGLTPSDRKQLKIGGQKQELSYVDTVKTYPVNVEIASQRTYGMDPTSVVPASQAAGQVTVCLNTSIVLLPEDVMRPRLADERVGYFTKGYTRFRDYGKTEHDQIISRYKLVPKNKKAYLAGKLVEPELQIVYYIDPATPRKWVPYLKAGIEDWNKAFEAAGFKNAIVARDWPDDPDMSVDDARYCVLLYLPSQKANAYGPRIVDPRSGQIIESHICWYHNVTTLLRQWYMVQCGPLDKRARNYEFDDELMGNLIRFVSSHEVGHTLGLRHNMIASNATPVEKLRDKAWVEEHGHTASIMDYARFNYVAQPEDGVTEKGLFPRVNDYDKWAIKWGYQWRPEFKDEYEEKPVLRKEVTRALTGNARLRYSGDEGRGKDPRSQTEDLGDNDMLANEYGMKNLRRVMASIEQWTAQPDGQYDRLEDIYGAVLAQYRRYCNHVQKWIGGKLSNNWPSEKRTEYVPKDKQKEALQWLGRNLLSVPQWLYPERVTTKTMKEPDADIQSAIQTFIGYILQPGLLDTMDSQGVYPAGEWLDDVMAEVWKPLKGVGEWDARHRRQAERAYVSSLDAALNGTADKKQASQAGADNSDARLYLLQNMNKVEKFVNAELAGTSDGDINNLHYRDLLSRINKIRKRYEGEPVI